ncbi:MAG: amidohydrolase family protein [Planctomycetes bacterium]|jgi:dihydroorotase|nr:amidohydrolase family protein [Planctomycetota bacterium]
MPDAASPPLIITQGRVIDPRSGRDETADVVLAHGKVQKIGKATDADRTGGAQTIDAAGRIVCPGLIDPQVHFREPGQEDKETIETGAASAVAGGFTSVVCMANTRPAIDSAALVEYVYTEARKAGLANVFPVGAVTKGRQGEELAEIGLMNKAGAVAFTDDGDCIGSAAVMAKALAYVKMTGKVLMQHGEEPSLVGKGAMNAGALCTRLGLPGRPAVAEELAILRDVTLNRSIGCRYHVQHLSTGAGLDVIRHAQQQGQPVTTEVAPHHLLLTEEACAGYDTNYKMNPPLRTGRDIEALIDGVRDGNITILATDHAPHTPEEKALEFAEAPAGILGLDCALALYAKALLFDHDACDWPKLLGMMTHAPATLCNLQGKGELLPGADADMTIIDPEMDWTIDVDTFASKARNCPFHGWQVKARATHTIVGGALKWALV